MPDIYNFLGTHQIPYQRYDHPALFTCEDAVKLGIDIPGVSTKNLFLRDKNGLRHFLVTVDMHKSVDLKKLQETLGVAKLSFGSEERLEKYLGVKPGSVTLLGLIHDPGHAVEVLIDADIWGKALQCHPLVNTATLLLQPDAIGQFLAQTGHQAKIMDVPSRG